MAKIEINKERCKGCQLCILYCKNACIAMDTRINKKGAYPALFLGKDRKCTGCSLCAIICPDFCITVYK